MTVYLPMPYLLAFDAEPFERTVHTVQHRAVGLDILWAPAYHRTVRRIEREGKPVDELTDYWIEWE